MARAATAWRAVVVPRTGAGSGAPHGRRFLQVAVSGVTVTVCGVWFVIENGFGSIAVASWVGNGVPG